MATVRRALVAVLVVVAAAAAAPGAGAVGTALATEPFASQQWALERIEAEAAWQVTKGAGAVVGIVDTGADLRHEELQTGKIQDAIRCSGTNGDWRRCTGSAQDDNGHGTHVAGVIAAPLNGKGIGGVAPEAKLLVVKSVGADGVGYADDVVSAIDFLVNRGAHVINLSLADAETVGKMGDPNSPIGRSIRNAWRDRGIVFVLAAGNRESGSNGQSQDYGALPAIVVGATNRDDKLASYSLPLGNAQWGIAAPGGDSGPDETRKVVSSYWPTDYAYSQGTSVAAPHVAGVAALAVSKGIRGQAAVDAILGGADTVSCGQGCRGRVNARKAVGAPPLPPSPSPTTKKPPVSSLPTAPPITVAEIPAPPTSEAPTTLPVAELPFEAQAGAPVLVDQPMVDLPAPDESLPAGWAVSGVTGVALAGLSTATVAYRSRRRTVTTRP